MYKKHIMPIPSKLLNSDRISYSGSVDDHGTQPVISLRCNHNACFRLLVDYLLHESSNEDSRISTTLATTLWNQYDHSHHTNDMDHIACVATMIRNNVKSNNVFVNHNDEKRFYYDRLSNRHIGGSDLQRNVTQEARIIGKNITAR